MKENTTADLLPHARLLFEIEHPSLEECYQLGYQMAQEGISEEENPFDENLKEREYWSQGWWDGLYGVQPMFDFEITTIMHESPIEELHLSEVSANEAQFEAPQESKITTVAKLAAALAGAFLSYQVIDMIA